MSCIPTDWGNGLETTKECCYIKMFRTRLQARLFIYKLRNAYEDLFKAFVKAYPSLIPIPHYEMVKKGFKIIKWKDTSFCEEWFQRRLNTVSTTVSNTTVL